MSMTSVLSSTFDIIVAGAILDPLVSNLLTSAEVDNSMFLPSEFRLVFNGSPTQIIEMGGFQLAVPVVVSVTTGGVPTPLITGEVTGVEVEYGPDGCYTVVRGMDRSHRLMHGTSTMGYPEMMSSDVVTTLIAQAGIAPSPDGFEPTTTVYEWLSQANISAWAFIQQLAALENYVAFVDNLGMFHFCPMPTPDLAPPPVASYMEPNVGGQLIMNRNLIRLRGNVTGAEQVDSVMVMGYDPKVAMPIVAPGVAVPVALISEVPQEVAGELGGTTPFVDTSHPFDMEGAAEKRAAAIAADIAGALAELEGQTIGDPSLLAGKAISIGMAGLPFDGQYVITAARHVWEPKNGGYTTWFTVGGRRDRSLLALAGGATLERTRRANIGGLVIGKVTDNMDPDQLGRVKVMFPWLSDSYFSAWARTMQIGASVAGAGFLWVPEVGDEVLVGFDRGDIEYPYVIGNLYNGIYKPEPAPAINAGVASRRIVSKTRHMIQFDDGPEAMGITIQSGTQTVLIKLDAEEQAITIQSAGQVTVQAAEAMTLKAGADFQIQGADITIQGSSITMSAENTAISATNLSMLAETSASVTAPEISLGA